MNAREQATEADLCRRLATALAERDAAKYAAALTPTLAAARAEGDKQGAARVREAVEAVLRSAGYGGALEPFSPELIQRVRAALTEAAPE